MATVSITQLPVYNQVLSTTGDVVPIVDVTNNTTKKISVANLLAGVPQSAVTSVGLAAPASFTVSNTPITSSGNLTLAWNPASPIPQSSLGQGQYNANTFLRGDGLWSTLPSSGSVSSVGVSMPAAFTVSNSPITSNGVIGITYSGAQIPPTSLGAGVPSSNVFLAGDGVWRQIGGASGVGSVTSITAGTGLGAPTSGATITVAGTISLLPATTATLGGVIVGSGIAVSPTGTISVTIPNIDQVLLAGSTTTRSITLGAASVGSSPVNSTDVVRLSDLQQAVQVNVQFRAPVTVVATASIGTTYNNGTAGVGATVSGTGTLVIDGSTPALGVRVLLVGQGVLAGAPAGASNGVYNVTSNTAGSWVLTRVSPATEPLVYGNYHFVTSGSVNISNSYILNTAGTITIGTTPINYVLFAANPQGAVVNPSAGGVINIGASSRYAREDHVHPFSVAVNTPASVASLAYNNVTGVLTFTPAAAGAGAVTSIAIDTSGLTPVQVSNSPITSSGTIGLSWGTGVIPPANLGTGAPSSAVFLAGDSTWRSTVSSVSANGITPLVLTVTSANSTPTITASWGTGQIPVANLGSGTADATKFLSGSGAWQSVVSSFSASGVAPLTFTVTNPNSTPALSASWGTGQIPAANLGSGTPSPTTFLSGTTPNATWAQAVTSVGINATGAAPLVVSNSPITGSGNIALTWGTGQIPVANLGSGTASTSTFLRGDGSWVSAGTITSVGLTMPAGVFTVTNSPITSSGNINVAFSTGQIPVANLGTGTPSNTNFLRGDGTWVTTGTVVSVGLDVSGASGLVVTNSPITYAGSLNLAWSTGASAAKVPVANLGSGTATATNFLRGDQTWANVVTSVALTMPSDFTVTGSPITTNGTIAVTRANQAVASFLAGPSSGSTAGAPTFRAIVPTDLGTGTPSNTNYLRGDGTWATLPGGGSVTSFALSTALQSAFTVTNPTTTPLLDLSSSATAATFLRGDGTWAAPGGGGTVTSVNVGTVASAFSMSIAAQTSAPSISLAWGTGLVPTANLGSGTASATTFLAGDQSYKSAVTSIAMTVPAEFTVTGSPITTSGTLAIAKVNQGANLFYAGPSSGAAVAPTFRAIATGDLGTGTASTTNFLRGDLSWSPAVTSVGLAMPAEFTVTNSPVTGSATLTVAKANQNINTFYAGPSSSSSGAPTFRTIATADLGTGTADNTKFLRGDLSWQTAVTSVGLSVPAEFTVTNSPVTGAATLTMTKANQSPNQFWAGPSSGSTAAAPTFRALVAADHGTGTASATTFLRGDLTWSGTLNGVALQSTPTVTASNTPTSGALSINVGNGAFTSVTLVGATTLSFTGLSLSATTAITVAVYHSGGSGTGNFINNVTGVGTVRWRGGTAPTAGTTSDFYQFTIIGSSGPCLASYTPF